ncbi:MAG: glycosyltransferase 87 family protein [Acidimicrobiia bacterium]
MSGRPISALTKRVGPDGRGLLLDTGFRAVLGVGLYAIAPYLSDVHRLWRRDAGLVPGGFGPGQFEYPPLSALYWGPISALPNSVTAVIVNGVVMVAVAVLITYLLLIWGGPERNVRIWARSLVLLFFLPIGWDGLVALMILIAVHQMVLNREYSAGVWAGAGAALKVVPGVLFLPVLPLLRDWASRLRFVVSGTVVVAISYVLYALARPESWLLHIDFASVRDDTGNTLVGWLGIGLSPEQMGYASTALLGCSLVALTYWAWRSHPPIADVALLAVAAFLLANKVHKPQYVLWLIPLLALVGCSSRWVRIMEVAAVAELATIYIEMPDYLSVVAGAVRVVAIVVLVVLVISGVHRQDRNGGRPAIDTSVPQTT